MAQVVENIPDIPDKEWSTANKGIPMASILEYREQGLTLEEIGKLVGCSKQTVWERLEPYKASIEGLDAYKSRKSDVLQLKQSMLLDALTPDSIKEMSGYQLVGSYGILYDKGNLEQGKATSHVSIAEAATLLVDGLSGLSKDLDALPSLDDEG